MFIADDDHDPYAVPGKLTEQSDDHAGRSAPTAIDSNYACCMQVASGDGHPSEDRRHHTGSEGLVDWLFMVMGRQDDEPREAAPT